MPSWMIAVLVKPLIVFLLFLPGAIVVVLIRRYMKSGKLKDFLLR